MADSKCVDSFDGLVCSEANKSPNTPQTGMANLIKIAEDFDTIPELSSSSEKPYKKLAYVEEPITDKSAPLKRATTHPNSNTKTQIARGKR